MIAGEIVLVEDDPAVALVVAAGLRFAGFNVTESASEAEARRAIAAKSIDLLILDIGKEEVPSLLRRVRRSPSDLPTMYLTEPGTARDRVRGLTLTGDDYLTKPFSAAVLVERVCYLLRRVGRGEGRSVLRCGDVVLDDLSHEVHAAGHSVELSPTEYTLLQFLLRNAGRVVPRRQIVDHVWDYDYEGQEAVVEVFMSTLRKKLGPAGAQVIKTVRGAGYCVSEP